VVSRLARILLPLRVTQRHFGVVRPSAARGSECLDQLGPRLGGDQRVAFFAGESCGLDAAGRDGHRVGAAVRD
jgi:hypothetical protein